MLVTILRMFLPDRPYRHRALLPSQCPRERCTVKPRSLLRLRIALTVENALQDYRSERAESQRNQIRLLIWVILEGITRQVGSNRKGQPPVRRLDYNGIGLSRFVAAVRHFLVGCAGSHNATFVFRECHPGI